MPGPSARTGASSARPSASEPRNAALTTTNERPRIASGIAGSGGKCMMLAHVVISSGSVGSSSVHARRTSAVCSMPKNMAPA
jgi:hypothetical protein